MEIWRWGREYFTYRRSQRDFIELSNAIVRPPEPEPELDLGIGAATEGPEGERVGR